MALPTLTCHLLSDMGPLGPVRLAARGGHLGQASLLAWEAARCHALVGKGQGRVCDWKMEPPACCPAQPGLLQQLQL